MDDPNTACPDTGKPDMVNPCLENRPQLKKDKRNTEFIKYRRIKSYPIKPPQVPIGLDRIGYRGEGAIGDSLLSLRTIKNIGIKV